jgi:hypothetical protein
MKTSLSFIFFPMYKIEGKISIESPKAVSRKDAGGTKTSKIEGYTAAAQLSSSRASCFASSRLRVKLLVSFHTLALGDADAD